MDAANLSSGKGHRDENFPVASLLIRKANRPVILAFYRFARAADDVADYTPAERNQKLRILERMLRTLAGRSGDSVEAAALRRHLLDRNLTEQHGLELLEAFRRDITKLRYRNWDELMDYCRYSAAPVGRFVLEVHGESRATWPASDALCSALQVINHLQDCGQDYRALDRVYLPLDLLRETGAEVTDLAAEQASPPLRKAVSRLAMRTQTLLARSRRLAAQIRDHRLAMEVGVIQRLAENLACRLLARDPLSERVHHSLPESLLLALAGGAGVLSNRIRPRAQDARAFTA
ncbi:MAG TPA: squalene synthase HpnC [Rhizomicrobium sp.]|jgi:squalene synthase HpnC|nr:squalene synthase HpnC [Rhizomicrobium sp.]